jgi:3-oxoacyl-[acyl-carrier-protein] synthase II
MFYIRSTGSISPQKTFGQAPFLTDPIVYTGNRLTCIEPDYAAIIDGKLIRRMSRIIKMGVAAALECLKEAGIPQPDAIVTGTAYGCLQDTEVFLTRIVENKEEMLTPTAFIQSTHNTVSAQIALMLQCHNYNNTFVHRGFSFESALLDAMTLLLENPQAQVLVGGVDEITDTSHAILSRLGFYRHGAAAGEGAAFFLLAGQPAPKSADQTASAVPGQPASTDLARLEAISTFYNPQTTAAAEQSISSFLKAQSIDIHDIDLILTGRNGDEKNDALYHRLEETIFKGRPLVDYKNLCGEYPTSTAFALWLAANMLKTGQFPGGISASGNTPDRQPPRKILIYNHYLNRHHSLFLVSAC